MTSSARARQTHVWPEHRSIQPRKESTVRLGRIGTRPEWLAGRKDLLAKEKDVTWQRDLLSAERRNLPMVEIEKDYHFDGPNGTLRLIDIFEDRPQLIIYH